PPYGHARRRRSRAGTRCRSRGLRGRRGRCRLGRTGRGDHPAGTTPRFRARRGGPRSGRSRRRPRPVRPPRRKQRRRPGRRRRQRDRMSVLSRDVPAAPPRGLRRAAPVGRRAGTDATVRVLAASALWLSLLLVTYWWDADGGIRDLNGWVTGLDSLGRLTGLVASVLLLAQVLLMARVPRLEAAYGQDRLAQLHRLVGFTSFNLMLAHIVLITWGYAAGQLTQTPSTLWNLVVDYPGMLLATGGTVCLFLVVFTSIKAARRRIRYESWHLLHLYAYLGVGLALPHQLWTGQQFLSSPGRTFFWWTAWAVAAGSVVLWRIGLPVWRNLWHRLEVTSVVRETD